MGDDQSGEQLMTRTDRRRRRGSRAMHTERRSRRPAVSGGDSELEPHRLPEAAITRWTDWSRGGTSPTHPGHPLSIYLNWFW